MFDPARVARHIGIEKSAGFWSVDLATRANENADYTVLCRWLDDGERLHLAECLRFRANYPDVRRRLVGLAAMYADDVFVFPADLIELLMTQELREDVAGHRIVSVKMRGDKSQKAAPFAAGFGSDIDMWLREVAEFPLGRYDDCVDAGSVAVHYLLGRSSFEALIRKSDDAVA